MIYLTEHLIRDYPLDDLGKLLREVVESYGPKDVPGQQYIGVSRETLLAFADRMQADAKRFETTEMEKDALRRRVAAFSEEAGEY